MDPQDLAEEMLAAPAALAYLAIAEASGLTLAQAARPHTALFLAAEAIRLVGPWDVDRDAIGEALRHATSGLRAFARDLAAQEELERGWFAPVERHPQVWIEGRSGGPPRRETFVDPADPNRGHRGWEAYAQKSAGGLYTCSAVDGLHPVLMDGEGGDAGDYHPEPDTPLWLLPPERAARVFEIRDAWDWHALAARYPMRARESPGAEGDGELLTPDWAAVAAEWDGVHLTVGGMLLAEQRTVERDGVRTRHWAWDCEQTLWLRWVFAEPEPFSAAVVPAPPLRLPGWYAEVRRGDGDFTLSAVPEGDAPRPAARSPRRPAGAAGWRARRRPGSSR